MKWQPIETAPKNNTDVLVTRRVKGDEGPCDAVDTAVAGWLGAIEGEGKWAAYACDMDVELHFDPTHWQPLPAPPYAPPSPENAPADTPVVGLADLPQVLTTCEHTYPDRATWLPHFAVAALQGLLRYDTNPTPETARKAWELAWAMIEAWPEES